VVRCDLRYYVVPSFPTHVYHTAPSPTRTRFQIPRLPLARRSPAPLPPLSFLVHIPSSLAPRPAFVSTAPPFLPCRVAQISLPRTLPRVWLRFTPPVYPPLRTSPRALRCGYTHVHGRTALPFTSFGLIYTSQLPSRCRLRSPLARVRCSPAHARFVLPYYTLTRSSPRFTPLLFTRYVKIPALLPPLHTRCTTTSLRYPHALRFYRYRFVYTHSSRCSTFVTVVVPVNTTPSRYVVHTCSFTLTLVTCDTFCSFLPFVVLGVPFHTLFYVVVDFSVTLHVTLLFHADRVHAHFSHVCVATTLPLPFLTLFPFACPTTVRLRFTFVLHCPVYRTVYTRLRYVAVIPHRRCSYHSLR